MAEKIRVWLNDDRDIMHHADADQAEGMDDGGFHGTADCGRSGPMKLVHHENVDMGKLCEECMAVSGVRPALAGDNYGPV